MNLLNDRWIPAKRENGIECVIAPWEIGLSDNPVVEITSPRPDFRGALYQFMIGLIQTAYVPEDDDEWKKRWENIPSCEELKMAFGKFAEAFELVNEDGPAFMQDFDIPKSSVKEDIYDLLIDSPGENTIKNNKDHFIKRDKVNGLCDSCAASALITLQTSASSGGAGHRTSMRGGGPLTTIVYPELVKKSIWNIIWINVLTLEEKFNRIPEDNFDNAIKLIFPWLDNTHDSEPPEETKEEKAERLNLKKTLSNKEQSQLKRERELPKMIFPNQVNELQQYWATPRRIRLFEKKEEGVCGCCGKTAKLWSSYKTKNYGCQYSKTWVHSLSPYFRIKGEDGSISLESIKGKEGGFCYTDWLSLTIGSNEDEMAASVVISFYEHKIHLLNDIIQNNVWCFGFEMDKDKTRCWYDQIMPLINIRAEKNIFIEEVQKLIIAAKYVPELLSEQIKFAWKAQWDEKKKKLIVRDFKGDISFIRSAFWEETEMEFYKKTEELRITLEGNQTTSPILKEWRTIIIEAANKLFDRFALQETDVPGNMKRIAEAAKKLDKDLNDNQSIKILEREDI